MTNSKIIFKQNLITFSLYYITTVIVLKLMYEPVQAILVWPAVGIGMVAALVWGYKVIPGLYLAQLGISVLLSFNSNQEFTLQNFYTSNIFIMAEMFRCYFGAYLIKYFIGYPTSLVAFRMIIRFIFFGGVVATLVATLVFAIIKLYLGFIATESVIKNSLDWWFGDILGFIIFAPIALIFISQPRSIWKPRLATVGLPMVLVLLSVIFIYNKYQLIDSKRVTEHLQVTNNLIASKLEQHSNWINHLINSSLSHFLPKADAENTKNKVNSYYKSLKNSDIGANAIIWDVNGEINYSKTSSKYSDEKFANIKTLDLEKLQPKSTATIIHTSLFLQESNEIVSVYKYSKKDGQYLTIYVIHDFNEQIAQLAQKYKLVNTNIYTKINNQDTNLILLNKASTRAPNDKIVIASNFQFNNENWTLINEPSAKFIFHNKSNPSLIIAKIGLLLTGLIGIMLLIITGKTTLIKIQVKERTIDLDRRAQDFKNRKIEYQHLIEQHPVILWRQNIKTGKMSYISNKVEQLFGYPLKHWLARKDFWLEKIHPNDRENVKNIINKSLIKKTPFELTYRFIKKDLSIAWIKDVVNINLDKNLNTQLVGLMVDETETKRAKVKQHISEDKYRTLFKYANDALLIINLNTQTFIDSNEKARELFGLSKNNKKKSLLDISPSKQIDGSYSNKRLKKIFNKLELTNKVKFEWAMVNTNKDTIRCVIELVKLPEEDKNIALADIHDITEKIHREKKINQLAYYDSLTKLPSRQYFYTKFSYFHERATLEKKYGTIIYLDLDRFKILNDTLGHQAGDQLLQKVAQRIRKVCQKKNDFCARLGGDEFVILSKNLNPSRELTIESSLIKAELILEELNKPYQLGNYEHFITPSIGLAAFPDHDNSHDQIIHHADIAMYASKKKGKNTITIYQDNMDKMVAARLGLEKAIRQAFEKNEFKLFYQPQYSLNNESTAVEALLRWHRSSELNINTEELIEIIEQIGLIHELGYWVLHQACAHLQEWQSKKQNIRSVAINVSSKQFNQKIFTEQIISIIDSYNISPSQIVIELTEAVIIEDIVSLISKFNELRNYGIRISLDDFGTGYSSLAYLKKLPLDQVKIDKMFVQDICTDEKSQHIFKTVIDLASVLNIELVAEGIETKQQFTILKQFGCTTFQGYYFSHPVAHDKMLNVELPKSR
ncbi:MAG: EAL domain-containing protein [Proteobacteria bacterium]|nr:EAL domain-containing protein [Pseudomonadota bacterium]